jgi:hypothetical protein
MSLSVYVELELSAGVWTVCTDVLLSTGLSLAYGLEGNALTDRVAGAGTMTFALDNSEQNSTAKIGYYSPGHANCRSGFGLGLGVRIRFVSTLVPVYYKWRGVIDQITPTPGLLLDRRTRVVCVDWMDEAAKSTVRGLSVQTAQRSDQLFNKIVAAMIKQPAAKEVGYGMEQYAYAFDGSRDEGLSVLTEFQKLANSELGFVYTKGDTVQGGTLTFEDRRKRGIVTSSVLTLTSLNELPATRKRDQITNRVLVTVHPRRVDNPDVGFHPSSLSPTMWLDASEGLDAILNDGEAVTNWISAVSGITFSQSTASFKPTLQKGYINGRSAVHFDGVNDRLTAPGTTLAGIINAGAGVVFIVARRTGNSPTYSHLFTDSNGVMILAHRTSPRIEGVNDDGAADTVTLAGAPTNDAYIQTWRHAGGNIYIGLNDTRDAALVSAASGNSTPLTGTLVLGAEGSPSIRWFPGDIAELFVFNADLTEADRMNIESFLSNEYAITVPYPLTGLGAGGYVVIFNLDVKVPIPKGTTFKLQAPYKDPNQKKARIGSVSQRPLIPTTDYKFNTLENGTGLDITDQLTITPVFGGNSATLSIVNNGPADGVLTFLQIRGLGVYDEGEVIYTAENTASQTAYGENTLPFDMAYQSDPKVAENAAFYLLSLSSETFTVPPTCTFICDSEALTYQALTREVSDRITIQDSVTGVNADFFINSVALEIDREGILTCTWGLGLADTSEYWELNSATRSQLNTTTRLAYGLWNRYWILGVASMSNDTRLS